VGINSPCKNYRGHIDFKKKVSANAVGAQSGGSNPE
jgi:hypothetical protein